MEMLVVQSIGFVPPIDGIHNGESIGRLHCEAVASEVQSDVPPSHRGTVLDTLGSEIDPSQSKQGGLENDSAVPLAQQDPTSLDFALHQSQEIARTSVANHGS